MIVRLNMVNLTFITIDLINRESTLHIIARFSDPNIEVLIGIWLYSQQLVSLCDRIMARVNYNDIWKELSDPDFITEKPETEYDIHHMTKILQLIMDGIEMLNGPIPLSQDQRNDMIIHVKQLQDKLHKDSILVNRVDPRVPIYERTPLEEYLNDV